MTNTTTQHAANEVLADLMSAEHERLSEKVGHRNWSLSGFPFYMAGNADMTYWCAGTIGGEICSGRTPDEAVEKMLSANNDTI